MDDDNPVHQDPPLIRAPLYVQIFQAIVIFILNFHFASMAWRIFAYGYIMLWTFVSYKIFLGLLPWGSQSVWKMARGPESLTADIYLPPTKTNPYEYSLIPSSKSSADYIQGLDEHGWYGTV